MQRAYGGCTACGTLEREVNPTLLCVDVVSVGTTPTKSNHQETKLRTGTRKGIV